MRRNQNPWGRFLPYRRRPEVSLGLLILGHRVGRAIADGRKFLTHAPLVYRSNCEYAARPNSAVDCASLNFANAVAGAWRQFGSRGPWRFRPASPTFSPVFVRFGQTAPPSTSHQECAMRPNLDAGSVARDSARALTCRSPTRAALFRNVLPLAPRLRALSYHRACVP